MTDNQNSEAPPPPAVPPAAPPPPPAAPAAAPPPPAVTPPPPPTVTPPPVGQPIGQQAYPPAYGAAPATGPRSTGKFVTGIILTVVGGLWILGGLGNLGIAASAFGDNPGYATGRLVGGLLIPIALLIVGIVLIRGSKPKAP